MGRPKICHLHIEVIATVCIVLAVHNLSRQPCREKRIHCHEVQTLTVITQIPAPASVATVWREQLKDQDMGPIQEEVEARQSPDLKYIADRSPTCRSRCKQRKSLTVRSGILGRPWESTDGGSIILSRNRVIDVLAEIHSGPSGGHMGVNKTSVRSDKGTADSRRETMLRNVARIWDTCAANRCILLLVYMAFTYNTMGLTPTALRPAGSSTPYKDLPTIDHAANVVDRIRHNQNYVRYHLKLASDRMKTHYDRLANCVIYMRAIKCDSYLRTRGRYHLNSNPHERAHTR